MYTINSPQAAARDAPTRSRAERTSLTVGASEHAASFSRGSATELVDLQRRRDLYLAMVAHELRNAMAPIAAGLTLLDKQSSSAGGAGDDMIPMLHRQLRHMALLVNDLVDVGRQLNDVVSVACQPVTLQDLAADAVQACGPMARAKAQHVSRDGPAEAVVVHADPARMKQVLLNIVGNAIKFTPVHGTIRLRIYTCAAVARLTVTDNGRGLEPGEIDRIFDVFCHASRTAEEGDGMGVGLSLSRRLVELQGGRLTASSAGRGRGATFTVEFPLIPA